MVLVGLLPTINVGVIAMLTLNVANLPAPRAKNVHSMCAAANMDFVG